MEDSEFICFIGYHGTNSDNKDSIIESNFKPSMGKNEWLGEGIYFFVEGISNPKDDAMKWAIAESHEKNYDRFSVLEAEIKIEVDKFWDITTEDGLKKFNYLRDVINKKEKRIADNDIITDAIDKFGFLGIKCRFYIKFKKERILRLNSRISNTTVLVVKESKCIIQASIKEIDKGKINKGVIYEF